MKKENLYKSVLFSTVNANRFLKELISVLQTTMRSAPFMKVAVKNLIKEKASPHISDYPYAAWLYFANQFFNIKMSEETQNLALTTLHVECFPNAAFLEQLVINGAKVVSKRNRAKLKASPISKFIDMLNDPMSFIQDLPIMNAEANIKLSIEQKSTISLIEKESILKHIRDAKFNLGLTR